jgi:putative Ca2+/H+ antiporter (TMEM165/GDT1 family)
LVKEDGFDALSANKVFSLAFVKKILAEMGSKSTISAAP